ncbi:dienelactone hydrolase [Pseudoxanthomonas kalamensis DSM 18571]|uniref:dienelactone hydrolase family protein n=1 Tax=Pseudoxanthomonas kalamensis TaxID=289483 RepID=UPI001390FDBF|nr:dienelactone hydrolase family protein [Pseudoxanthomonas kalamensis]KAF1709305.1 dienelactone hydrolase [Pseudoxanthomonas kalamensis DSM 18571]
MRNVCVRLAGLIGLLWLGSAQAEPQARPLEWGVGGERFSGYLVYDPDNAAPRPGLVMVPNWMGVTDAAVEKAKAIAGRQYVVLVADVYGKERRPSNAKEAGAIAGSLRGEDREPLRARIRGAVDALKAQAGQAPLQADKIGALGFCFGGSTVLELARSGADDVAGVVSLHGGLTPGGQSATLVVKTPMLVLNGADDKSVSAADVVAFQQEMDTAGADWQFVDYSGAVHCFAEADAGNDPASNCRYDERAAKRAYRAMADFFAEVFDAAD